MNNPNPKDVILWTLRRGEGDTVNMYNYLAELMQISTGKNFLNFGYWDDTTKNPADAQTNLCNLIGNMAELGKARQVLDVGSGFSEPAFIWKKTYQNITVTCVNINPNQLKFANIQSNTPEINLVNATAVKIPISNESFDRIIALESAQHFKPIKEFISETQRILKKNGIAIFAIPVLSKPSKFGILKIGILKLTWSSEHYNIDTVKKTIQDTDLKIAEIKLVGSKIYLPLAEYYIQNRPFLRSEILKKYPSYVEKILFKSMQKMKQAATDQTIEYILIKCIK